MGDAVLGILAMPEWLIWLSVGIGAAMLAYVIWTWTQW